MQQALRHYPTIKEETDSEDDMNRKPLVGISTCLTGEKVRYDGGHKLNRYLTNTLSRFVEFYPVCPEVECGLGTPREAMRLVSVDGKTRLFTRKSERDITDQMMNWMDRKLTEMEELNLCGFIFKAKSPSSGYTKVKVYNQKGGVSYDGVGLFSQGVLERFPLLPVEDDGRLNDAGLRENFISRMFLMHNWHNLAGEEKSRAKLMHFHGIHKYLLMSHSPAAQKELGSLIAVEMSMDIEDLYHAYFERFITAAGEIATVKKHTNVLLHVMGHFKKHLSSDEKQELKGVIDNYHDNLVPLIVPVTLINHYVRKYKDPYLETQYYLNPHPMELMLRNHV